MDFFASPMQRAFLPEILHSLLCNVLPTTFTRLKVLALQRTLNQQAALQVVLAGL
jgi:hypothetical protein